MIIHDPISFALRMWGFSKMRPNASPDMFIQWIILIAKDQEKDHKAQIIATIHELFSHKDKKFFSLYEIEILNLAVSECDGLKILNDLKVRFSAAKYFPSEASINLFLKIKGVCNG
ncbi:hypothetical protein [Sulfuricurvum sp.]|uniref:hypothetical protein n=1 Tax=Sulfuricurvum sp. TaxID=2025608 RepID=UPI003569E374